MNSRATILTPEEWQEAQTRRYLGVTQAQAYGAARKLFSLADPTDVMFGYEHGRLLAIRRAILSTILSAYNERWVIDAQEQEGATTITTSLELVGCLGHRRPQSVWPYRMFFSRMDYLLGKSNKWMTCEDCLEQIWENLKWQHYQGWGFND
jgi:hypothetical protein